MRRWAPLALLLGASAVLADELAPPKLEFNRVAVLVYAQTPAATPLLGSAQARLEQILLDNGIEVSDRDESSKIKSIWKKLEDPGYFVTADDFVSNTQAFGLDGVARIYLNADVVEVAGSFFSATAQADVRLVDEDAKVDARASFPMGAPGRPPSDGLTAQAALLNAAQRAIDETALALGLAVGEPASPRAMVFQLDGPLAEGVAAAPIPRSGVALTPAELGLAVLENARNTTETPSCSDRAPGGDIAVVGASLSRPAGRFLMFGSRVHLLDLGQQRELSVFETRALDRKPREHRGSSSVLDCVFVHSWRYLAAVTGDVLSVWDTERGLNLAEVLLPFGTEAARLDVLRAPDGLYLRVLGDDAQQAVYRLRSEPRTPKR